MKRNTKAGLRIVLVLCLAVVLSLGAVSASTGYCYESPGGIHDGSHEANYVMYRENSNGTLTKLGNYYKFTCTNCGEAVYTQGKPGIMIGNYVYDFDVTELSGGGGQYTAKAPAGSFLYSSAKYLPGWNCHF